MEIRMKFRRQMCGFGLITLFAGIAFAQNPAPQTFKAPPEVEEKLRARVSEFYQYHVNGTVNHQKAYGMVAEDTKEFYFDEKKSTFVSFKITGVKFLDDNFTKASVDLECMQKVDHVEFLNGTVLPVPQTTMWVIENGQWMWHRDPNVVQPTPMGPSDLESIRKGAKVTMDQLPQLTDPKTIQKLGQSIVQQSGVDTREVTLSSDKASAGQVTFHNGQAGYIKLFVDPGTKIAGFSAVLDKVDVGANENAVLKLSYTPPAPEDGKLPAMPPQQVQVRLSVEPFHQIFGITVNFTASAPANH
jgi:hypothetical protein